MTLSHSPNTHQNHHEVIAEDIVNSLEELVKFLAKKWISGRAIGQAQVSLPNNIRKNSHIKLFTENNSVYIGINESNYRIASSLKEATSQAKGLFDAISHKVTSTITATPLLTGNTKKQLAPGSKKQLPSGNSYTATI